MKLHGVVEAIYMFVVSINVALVFIIHDQLTIMISHSSFPYYLSFFLFYPSPFDSIAVHLTANITCENVID